MRLSIGDFASGLAIDGFGIHAVKPARPLAQAQIDDFEFSTTDSPQLIVDKRWPVWRNGRRTGLKILGP